MRYFVDKFLIRYREMLCYRWINDKNNSLTEGTDINDEIIKKIKKNKFFYFGVNLVRRFSMKKGQYIWMKICVRENLFFLNDEMFE